MKTNVCCTIIYLVFTLGAPLSAHAQSANAWYPTANPGLVVANVWYDTRQNWGSNSRIGVEFTTGMNAYFYFSSSNSGQLQEANAIYATLLSAQLSGNPVFLFINQVDPYEAGEWDFVTVQLGNND